jgi:hypothetical protein
MYLLTYLLPIERRFFYLRYHCIFYVYIAVLYFVKFIFIDLFLIS